MIHIYPGSVSRQAQVMQPRFGDTAPPPTVDGGRRQLQQPRNGRSPPVSIDDLVSGGAHDEGYAIIANSSQAKVCDIRDCDIRKGSLGSAMSPDEIKAELYRRGMSQRDLAEAIGMDENHLSKSLKGKRQFRLAEMDAIRKEFAPEPDEPGRLAIRTIPLLGEVPAGAFQPNEQKGGPRLLVADPDIPPRAYGLRIVGDSMDLIAPDGSTVIIDPDDKALWPGARYVVRTADGETTFKEYRDRPARLVPCSSNPEHIEIPIGSEPLAIEGKVFSYMMRDAPRRAT